jgi:hypothetical protein
MLNSDNGIYEQGATGDVPNKSRFGPTSMAFQLKEYFDGHIVKPS